MFYLHLPFIHIIIFLHIKSIITFSASVFTFYVRLPVNKNQLYVRYLYQMLIINQLYNYVNLLCQFFVLYRTTFKVSCLKNDYYCRYQLQFDKRMYPTAYIGTYVYQTKFDARAIYTNSSIIFIIDRMSELSYQQNKFSSSCPDVST